MKPHYVYGDNNAQCDVCGRSFKQSTLKIQWDKQLACKRCYDVKHPDLTPIVPPKEDPMIYDARPRPEIEYIDVSGISEWGGIMLNGSDYGTEFTWDEMDITWDELLDADNPPFK